MAQWSVIGDALSGTRFVHFAGYAPLAHHGHRNYRAVRERQRRRGFVVDLSAGRLEGFIKSRAAFLAADAFKAHDDDREPTNRAGHTGRGDRRD
jgi:hypothetical protein